MTHPSQASADLRPAADRQQLLRRINLQLAALGQPLGPGCEDRDILDTADDLLRRFREQASLLARHQCPADRRVQDFLDACLAEGGVASSARLPASTFVLDRPGLARELSLPQQGNHFSSAYIESYRTRQGVLHNPSKDRRTTEGVFHIAEGGLPVPADKRSVPLAVFARLLEAALSPPPDLKDLPFTSAESEPARVWISLYLRPLVSPAIPGRQREKSMEVRFFAPGGLAANLDFVERIFGNAGNPLLPENDAGLDTEHWCGTTGCVILAPHLVRLRKKDLGLPHVDQATERQRRDGMCWQDEDEPYNGGQAFKVVCRDHRGVIVSIIADNYFGYSKKEIKSHISYSANLIGGCEEEHAGGALVFARQNLGDSFQADGRMRSGGHTFADLVRTQADTLKVHPDGYAVDRRYPDIVYVPEDVRIDLHGQRVTWTAAGRPREIKLRAGHCYVHPSGYKVSLEKDEKGHAWRLVGTEAEGLLLHKPCTVSGGGKSEVAKSVAGSVLYGSVYVGDLRADLDQVDAVLRRDYSAVFRNRLVGLLDVQSLLSPLRPLSSVIRLLTPSPTDYTEAHNEWLHRIPQRIRALVFLIKRYYEPDWGEDWRRHFTVDITNGRPSHELRYAGRKLIASYLRVGFDDEGAWRVFNLRQDFVPAEKIQVEDDITVSAVVPGRDPPGRGSTAACPSRKFVANCEQRLFQRPDDAIVKGMDRQTERDLAEAGNFISNFQPLTARDAREIVEDVVEFDRYAPQMRAVIRAAVDLAEGDYFVSSAHPRVVGGKRSPNFRYLQKRADLTDPRKVYIAEVGARLHRRLAPGTPVEFPVNEVIPGRRNNPPDREAGIRPLSVYGPIHYQDLPELFMDFVASLTGKSPSTTGAGSEGAMTKGPFNALAATADLNAALVSFLLCGHHGFTTAAGFIGTRRRIDHDISMMVPEVWCRMPASSRDPRYLIANGCLERIEDFHHRGRLVPASRLGYRITDRFVHAYFGEVFDDPLSVFDEAMLRPETQDLDAFADGVENIAEAHRRVARQYLEDGSVEDACPPLRALLHIMAQGTWEGLDLHSPGLRRMFTAEHLLGSAWYRERLTLKQQRDIALWRGHVAYLEAALAARSSHGDPLQLERRLLGARVELERALRPTYADELVGTLGADPVHRARAGAAAARPDAGPTPAQGRQGETGPATPPEVGRGAVPPGRERTGSGPRRAARSRGG